MSCRELIFIESTGRMPPRGTLAARLLEACSVDDEDAWGSLGMAGLDEQDLEDAVTTLRSLGWDFFYGALQ